MTVYDFFKLMSTDLSSLFTLILILLVLSGCIKHALSAFSTITIIHKYENAKDIKDGK